MPLPTVIVPGYLESAVAYRHLEQSLQNLGFPAFVVPLRRRDWLTAFGGRPVTFILEQLDQVVKQTMERCDTKQVNLIGHSAGGWISRIYIGEVPYSGSGMTQYAYKAYPSVATLVSLGTPHISQERWTRKNIDFVNNNYPGAYYSSVRYICIAGKTIFGKRARGSWLAYSSYQMTCGNGNTWGDGITPIEAAHLKGAENIIIEGVLHSPRSPGIWYGSQSVLERWVKYLM